MKFNVITIFPEQLKKTLEFGVIGKAIEKKLIELNFIDPREFSDNDYGSIDDKAYGGGPGMVMQAEPILSSIEKAKKEYPDDPPPTREQATYLLTAIYVPTDQQARFVLNYLGQKNFEDYFGGTPRQVFQAWDLWY